MNDIAKPMTQSTLQLSFSGFKNHEINQLIELELRSIRGLDCTLLAPEEQSKSAGLVASPELMIALAGTAGSLLTIIIKSIVKVCKAKQDYRNSIVTIKSESGAALKFPVGVSQEELNLYVETAQKLNSQGIDLSRK